MENKEISRERLYFIIAGNVSLILLIRFLLFEVFGSILPMSYVYFSIRPLGYTILTIISIIFLFFILKGLSIMANKENFHNLEKFIIIFFIFVLTVFLIGIVSRFCAYNPYKDSGVCNVFSNVFSTTGSLILQTIIAIFYVTFGLWILKLRKDFDKTLIIFISLFYIYPAIMPFLISLIGLIFPQITRYPGTFGNNIILAPFSIPLLLFKIGGYICMSILFFRLAKNK